MARWPSWPAGPRAACWARSRWSSPATREDPGSALAEAVAEVARRAAGGQPRSEAIAAVARESGLRRRELYGAVVAARKPGPGRPDPQAGPPRG